MTVARPSIRVLSGLFGDAPRRAFDWRMLTVSVPDVPPLPVSSMLSETVRLTYGPMRSLTRSRQPSLIGALQAMLRGPIQTVKLEMNPVYVPCDVQAEDRVRDVEEASHGERRRARAAS
jgi:hypothetical protein